MTAPGLDEAAIAEVLAALVESWRSRTSDGQGVRREHWRGHDYVEGEDFGLETAADELAAIAARLADQQTAQAQALARVEALDGCRAEHSPGSNPYCIHTPAGGHPPVANLVPGGGSEGEVQPVPPAGLSDAALEAAGLALARHFCDHEDALTVGGYSDAFEAAFRAAIDGSGA